MIELPGYQLLRELGRGGMARVYLALHEGLDRHVAIKLLYPNLSVDSSFSDRFLREARIVARLNHPNIITVFDVNVHDSYHYIAMEYLPGDTLGDKIKASIEPSKALSYLKQMAMGLKFAHEKGFIHRDIKPENILFREDGTAVITDFGVARAEQSDTRMTAVGTIIGTPHYMSPEQAQGLEIKPNSDLYSLGIVFHEMLTGVVPFRADSLVAIMYKHVNEPIPELQGMLKIFQPLLDNMLAKKAEGRYQNAAEIIKDIDSIELRIAPDLETRIMPPNSALNKHAPERSVFTPLKKPLVKDLLAKKYVLVIASFVFISVASAILFVNLSDNEQPVTEIAKSKQNRPLVYQQRIEEERIRQEAIEQQAARQAAMDQAAMARQAIEQEKAARDRIIAEKARLAAEKARLAQEQRDRLAAERARLAQEKRARLAAGRARLAQEKRDRLAVERARLAQEKRGRIAADKARLALSLRTKVKKEQTAKQKVSRLNSRAESYLQKSRLKDAYKTYQQTLAIDTHNKVAKRGLNNVAARYLSLALSKAEKFNFSRADSYVRSASKISPKHPELATTQQKILTLKDKQLAQNTAQVEVQPAPAPEKPVRKQRTFGGF